MNSYPLMILCKKIRAAASAKQIKVNRGIKTPEWKTSLLALISDNVVLDQLRFIHPFQYVAEQSTTGYHVFRLPFFRYSIYVKIDKDISKVISFHYDEIPREPKHLNVYALDNMTDTNHLQVILEGTKAKRYLPLALGSFILSLYPKEVYTSSDGSEYIELAYLQNFLATSEALQELVIERLSEIDYDVDYLDLSIRDTNLLTWVNDDKALQTVSALTDAARSNPNCPWIRDTCVDIILSNPSLQGALDRYNNSLYPTAEKISIITDNSTNFFLSQDKET